MSNDDSGTPVDTTGHPPLGMDQDLVGAQPGPSTEGPVSPPRGRVRKFIVFTVGGLAMGIAGNAIWSEIAPPPGWTHRWWLSMITFGSAKMKDGIIQEAARGLHEESSDTVLYLLTFFLFLGFVIGWQLLKWHILGPPKDSRQLISKPATQKRVLYLLLLLIVAFFGSSMWELQNRKYAHSTTAQFRQVVTILKPHLDSTRIEQLEADFAGMRNEADFKKVSDELRAEARRNQLEVPDSW